MALHPPTHTLWLTIEVPGIYCDDMVLAAEDGFTPEDCLFEDIGDQVTVTVLVHGSNLGPHLMSHVGRIIAAHPEPNPQVDDA